MTTLVSAETTAPPVIAAPATSAAAQGAVSQGASQDKGLRAGALGLLSSVVIAVSSTAPAYSMAATLGLIVALVGVHSPGTLIVSFLPMLCIAYAFRELNKADPDCGTTFIWGARAFGPNRSCTAWRLTPKASPISSQVRPRAWASTTSQETTCFNSLAVSSARLAATRRS